MNKLELVVSGEAILGEGPCWDDRTGKLFWVDILDEKIYMYDPICKRTVVYLTGFSVGCIALREKAGLICAMQNGIYGFEPESGDFEKLLDRPDAQLANNRFNDGKCDPAGRFYVGTMSNDQNEGHSDNAPAGTLYRIDPDLSLKVMIRNVSISNGIAWHSNLKTMYYIDTPTQEVSSFDYDIEMGEIKNRQTIIRFHEESGIPDGMTIDTEDKLWIAHWGGSKISRWDPLTGKKLCEVMLPCKNVTCLAFGGANYDDLYITTARIGLDNNELKSQPEAGSLFSIKTEVPGKASFRFKG